MEYQHLEPIEPGMSTTRTWSLLKPTSESLPGLLPVGSMPVD